MNRNSQEKILKGNNTTNKNDDNIKKNSIYASTQHSHDTTSARTTKRKITGEGEEYRQEGGYKLYYEKTSNFYVLIDKQNYLICVVKV